MSQAETLLDEARRQAVANAQRRAKLYAAAAGAEVGEVLSIHRGRRGRAAPGVHGARRQGGERAHRAGHRDPRGQRHHHLGAEVRLQVSGTGFERPLKPKT
ncbi:MAG: SIMPL domain-containing protein [Hyphomicrobium sp.]